jgi:hypothetical protein
VRSLVVFAFFVLFVCACGLDTGEQGVGTGAGGGTASAGCTDTWSSYGATFFGGSCGGCHGGLSSHAGVQANAGSALSAISSGYMPRGAGLSQAARDRAVAYLQCGAP